MTVLTQSETFHKGIPHPLLSLKMNNYDVALLQLGPATIKNFDGTIPCFLTKRQFKTITRIIPKFSVTARIRKGVKKYRLT
jgi:hypothetical protein